MLSATIAASAASSPGTAMRSGEHLTPPDQFCHVSAIALHQPADSSPVSLRARGGPCPGTVPTRLVGAQLPGQWRRNGNDLAAGAVAPSGGERHAATR